MRYVFFARVDREGRMEFKPGEKERMQNRVRELRGRDVELSLDTYQVRRTDDQLKFYWAARMRPLAEHFQMPAQAIHEAMAARFLSLPPTAEHPGRVRSTSELTVEQMTHYIQEVEVYFATEYAFEFPDANRVRIGGQADNGQ